MRDALITLLVGVAILWSHTFVSHGFLVDPPSRATLWRRGLAKPISVRSTNALCGGQSHLEESEFGIELERGSVSKSFQKGHDATLLFDETGFQKGYLEFKLCPLDRGNQETQECFNQHPVTLANGGTKYYLKKKKKVVKVDVKIPNNVTCNFCVLQYHFHQVVKETRSETRRSQTGELYGCSDIKIVDTSTSDSRYTSGQIWTGPGGPSIQGIVVNGAANFGNIHGPGSVHRGNSNAWGQNTSGTKTRIDSDRGTQSWQNPVETAPPGPTLQNTNSAGQADANTHVDSGLWNPLGGNTILTGPYGPSIQGIVVNGPGNFGNIHGPGSVHVGHSNAWTQTNIGNEVEFESNRESPAGSNTLPNEPSAPSNQGLAVNAPGFFDQSRASASVHLGNSNAWTQETSGTKTQVDSGLWNQSGGNTILTGPYGPSIKGIVINGPGNFGNIHGAKSVHRGNSNAWTQKTSNTFTGIDRNVVFDNRPLKPIPPSNWNPNQASGDHLDTIPGVGSNLRIHPGYDTVLTGPSGPSIKGIVVGGSGNFGNIYGSGSVHSGNSNAWTQGTSGTRTQVDSGLWNQSGGNTILTGPYGPSIKGIAINGPGNFGNIHGPGSVHTGNSNAWTQKTSNTFTGIDRNVGFDHRPLRPIPPSNWNPNQASGDHLDTVQGVGSNLRIHPGYDTVLTGPSGPLIKGIVVHGQGNFGNIHGPGSVHSGNSNAWTQDTSHTRTHIGSRWSTLGQRDLISTGPYGPSIKGIAVYGPGNFGNIHGTGSVHKGNSNAWTQKTSNAYTRINRKLTQDREPILPEIPPGSKPEDEPKDNVESHPKPDPHPGTWPGFDTLITGPSGPSIKGIVVHGPGNFGNIYGKGSVHTGNANAWNQKTSDTFTSINRPPSLLRAPGRSSSNGWKKGNPDNYPTQDSRPGTWSGFDTLITGPSGPSGKGVVIHGPANFGNIHGKGSVHRGNSNAWNQKTSDSYTSINRKVVPYRPPLAPLAPGRLRDNEWKQGLPDNYPTHDSRPGTWSGFDTLITGPSGPSGKGIVIHGPGNFGNIYGKGSVHTGNANAWNQKTSDTYTSINRKLVPYRPPLAPLAPGRPRDEGWPKGRPDNYPTQDSRPGTWSGFDTLITGPSGPSGKGVVIHGPANFGNIHGKGSVHRGNSNAWNQKTSDSYTSINRKVVPYRPPLAPLAPSRPRDGWPKGRPGDYPTQDSRPGTWSGFDTLITGPSGPSGKGIVIHGPANFGNIHGKGSVHRGNSNAWDQKTSDSFTSINRKLVTYRKPSVPRVPGRSRSNRWKNGGTGNNPTQDSRPGTWSGFDTLVTGPSGPSIKGIVVYGPGNFGNIHGPGSVHTGDSNAWDQKTSHTFTNINRKLVLDHERPPHNIPPSTKPPNPGTHPGFDTLLTGPSGPSIKNIVVHGPGNFGNIHGPGSVHIGNSNAWRQKTSNTFTNINRNLLLDHEPPAHDTPPGLRPDETIRPIPGPRPGSNSGYQVLVTGPSGPSIKNIVVHGPGNFGNIHGKGSVHTGNSNAWTQRTSRTRTSIGSRYRNLGKRDYISTGPYGPEIQGIVVHGPGNFGNIHGPGSVHSGDSNAWTQDISRSRTNIDPRSHTFRKRDYISTGPYGPAIKGIVVHGPGNFGNIHGPGSVHSGNSNAWAQKTANTFTGVNRKPVFDQEQLRPVTPPTPRPVDWTNYPPLVTSPPQWPGYGTLLTGPYGPSIKGISVGGPGNFGNVYGSGSVHSGDSNAWTQTTPNTFTDINRIPVPYYGPLRPAAPTGWNPYYWTNYPVSTYPYPVRRPLQWPGYGTLLTAPYGPSIKGISVGGPGNFGNIYGPGSLHSGDSNAWTQDISRTPTYNGAQWPTLGKRDYISTGPYGPGINGIVVHGPGNFGNIHGPGSVHSGDSNAWTQDISRSRTNIYPRQNTFQKRDYISTGPYGPGINGIVVHGPGNFGNIHGPGSVHSGDSNAWTQDISHPRTNIYPRQNTFQKRDYISTGPYGPGINGIVVHGPGNFGNIHGPGSVHSGDSNAWAQNTPNTFTGVNRKPVFDQEQLRPVPPPTPKPVDWTNYPPLVTSHPQWPGYGTLLTGPYGPSIKGITVGGPGNFGNVYGSGSVHSGDSNAWTQDISRSPTNIYPRRNTFQKRDYISTGPYGPGINGIVVHGPGNFGNIHGPGSVHTGDSNAWAQNTPNTFTGVNRKPVFVPPPTPRPDHWTNYPPLVTSPPQWPGYGPLLTGPYGPSIKGISVGGPGNFGNVYGSGSVHSGDSNAWTQKTSNTFTGVNPQFPKVGVPHSDPRKQSLNYQLFLGPEDDRVKR